MAVHCLESGCIVYVHCREEGCIGLYIPDDQDICRGPIDVPRAKPEGHLEGRGKTKSRARCSTYSYFQVEKLVAAKVERVKNYRTLVNFSTKEMKEVNRQPLPLNSTLWRLQKPTC